MRRVLSKITLLLIINSIIVMVLSVCVSPINFEVFLNDPIVTAIIDKDNSSVDPGFEYEDRGTPIKIVKIDGNTIEENNEIILEPTKDNETITITNAEEFTEIKWHCAFEGTDISASLDLSEDLDELTVERGTAPFDKAGTYFITITGINNNNEPSSILFKIIIRGTIIELEDDNSTSIEGGGRIILETGSSEIIIITIANAGDFDSFVWKCIFESEDTEVSSDELDLSATDDTLTITENDPPFDTPGIYLITVIGYDTLGVDSSISFRVIIIIPE
jgi:hypothetical protein